MAKSCKGCKYWRSASGTNHGKGTHICHFLLDTGEKRGCPAENCSRYESEKKPKKQLPEKENTGMREDYIEIPNCVDDAVLERIEKLENKLALYDTESRQIRDEINELCEFHNNFIRCESVTV